MTPSMQQMVDAKNAANAARSAAETPILLTDIDAANLLGFSRSTLWRRVADGTISPPIKLGGATRWRRDELLRAVEVATAARDQGAA